LKKVKDKEDGTLVDESMFVQIDSSSQKEPAIGIEKEEVENEARVKDEL
jgi:hypothetical protein